MEVTAQMVKQLRERTGAPMMDCKVALTEAQGDLEQAVYLLRKKGLAAAPKKAGRITAEGAVGSYIHGGGRIGVLVEVNCETDFVARTPDFRDLAHDVAMHIAFYNPSSVDDEANDPSQLPLLKQPFIKDPSRTVADLVRDTAAKTGENIVVRRFTRFE